MATGAKPGRRARGAIEVLPSGSLRVRVYTGRDPITNKEHYLVETVPAGPGAAREAEKVRTRLLSQVDERRNPRTKATLDQLLDRWLDVAELDVTTRRNYVSKLNKHVRPVLGRLPLARVDAEVLESFYAQLRKCRERCGGRKYVKHRKAGEHECTDKCRPHKCAGLGASTVRQIHWILSGALERAVRWRWIAVNPASQAEPPAQPHPDPDPPTPEEAARIIEAAWTDPDWGALVWLAMTTGARRGELAALRWTELDLAAGVVVLRRSLYVDDEGELQEKDTKTHQQRRVALDPETVAVLLEYRERVAERLALLDVADEPEGYVFSPEPDGSRPWRPDSITQRYGRLAARLGIDTTIHSLRHYSATELINAGVDVRTVAGRLGHGGGGTTTLRVYAAWLSESDQRAAATLAARMPTRPRHATPTRRKPFPYEAIASELSEEIRSGCRKAGDQLPTIADLATHYGVSTGTAYRAISVLHSDGLVNVVSGQRTTVSDLSMPGGLLPQSRGINV